jgi:hypothetical protein
MRLYSQRSQYFQYQMPHPVQPPVQQSQWMRGMQGRGISVLLILGTTIALMPLPAMATEEPAAMVEDFPEEVLRSEILLDGRSPLTGERLSATEYVELQAEIEKTNAVEPQVAPKLRTLVGLVKLRKFIKTVLPIVPIK